MSRHCSRILIVLVPFLLCQCAGTLGSGNMGGPTVEERKAQIAAEPKGDYFVGRRYYVKKTRFWGYVRRPGQSWDRSKLVVMREDKKRTPDRFSENGSGSQRYGADQNYEYKLRGYFTGNKVYDPNSNQVLPEFMLTSYDLKSRQPGWIFRPDDRYDPYKITVYAR